MAALGRNFHPAAANPHHPANRRRFQKDPNAPSFYYKKAEDIPGYQKFTLDEVIYPEDTKEEVTNVFNARRCLNIFVQRINWTRENLKLPKVLRINVA